MDQYRTRKSEPGELESTSFSAVIVRNVHGPLPKLRGLELNASRSFRYPETSLWPATEAQLANVRSFISDATIKRLGITKWARSASTSTTVSKNSAVFTTSTSVQSEMRNATVVFIQLREISHRRLSFLSDAQSVVTAVVECVNSMMGTFQQMSVDDKSWTILCVFGECRQFS
jgi:hypothetical protein